jgi:hypothetical protein
VLNIEVELIGVSGWAAISATAPYRGWLDASGLFGQYRTMWLKLPQYRQRP